MALVPDESLPPHNDTSYIISELRQRHEDTPIGTNMIPGVCYSPFHNPEYPLHGGWVGDLNSAMINDFSIMKSYFSVVRTYYSSYYGIPVAPAAAINNVSLFLGVFMTNEGWYSNQVDDAITAVQQHPRTIAAILVGNENIWPAGDYSPQEVSDRITDLRRRLASKGLSVPIGTVQRAAEWLDSSRQSQMLALAANCDIVGVNIYPFFDANYLPQAPLAILNAIWDKMLALYPESKVRLTEIGFPTGGAPATYAPNNIPSLSNSEVFYNAFLKWAPNKGQGREAFWFMFFDRAPYDDTMQVELEKYFGFFTYDKKSKDLGYPLRLTQLMCGSSPAITRATTQPPLSSSPPPALLSPSPSPVPPPPTTQAPTQTPAPPLITTQVPAPAPTPATTQAPPPTSVPPPFLPTMPSTVGVCVVKKRWP
ncbi:TPA: hypothetical protein N0F65_009969 [Lagenidium giganteum]|uniref:glucan endo-1,3-beta-D-glucosidase n=1 Tax=Lagenidium giganteum TaxID=4803 RepID=A0AAV2YT80_9STRA|nr:TPA: hypothetical protein N0F65_009969 [Lagenidium giganteum]